MTPNRDKKPFADNGLCKKRPDSRSDHFDRPDVLEWGGKWGQIVDSQIGFKAFWGMAQTLNRLNAKSIDSLAPGRHADGGNLYLDVKTTGTRSWYVRVAHDGKVRDFGLGAHCASFGLRDARTARDDLKRRLSGGADAVPEPPSEAPAPKIVKPTFAEVAEDVITLAMRDNFGAKTEARWRRALFHHCGALCPLTVDEIDTPDVVAALEPIWTTKPSMARKTREHLERVFDYAKAKGLRSGDNPARWNGHLDQLLARVAPVAEPHAALHWSAAPAFLRRLGEHTGVGRNALELVIFTGARSGEVRGATWGEIDLKRKLWSIPRGRTKERRTLEKARRTHKRIPLSPPAIALLERIRPARARPEDHVFPAPTGPAAPMSENGMLALVDGMGAKADVTPHGFRSTFRDWAAEQRTPAMNGRMVPAYSYEAAEMSLGHVVGSEVTRAYLRSDLLEERRDLMNDWAAYLCGAGFADRERQAEAA